jgi:hypothetical protein
VSHPIILVQLDTDPQPSVFDSVVALDSGVEHLLRHSGVTPETVTPLVHGAIFTRGGENLRRTALFVGGSDVGAGERLLQAIRKAFFGPMSVSVLMDSNGSNTTSAAAVLAVGRHTPLENASALVLGASGPVGSRVVRLLASQGASVRVASRQLERAEQVCTLVRERYPDARLEPVATGSQDDVAAALQGRNVLIAAGAFGVELCSTETRQAASDLRVVVDLNAVPPLGVGGLKATDRAVERDGQIHYGAIGVGGSKMTIHRAAIERLFTANNLVLDAEEVFAIGQELG